MLVFYHALLEASGLPLPVSLSDGNDSELSLVVTSCETITFKGRDEHSSGAKETNHAYDSEDDGLVVEDNHLI